MAEREKWLKWAMELQSLAQAGLEYGKDKFDLERYERIREISAEMISHKSEISIEKVKELFCNEKGYQTPKIDVRAAIFKNNRILLVRENDGKWSLPGGWADINLTLKENVIKESKEEAGVDVLPEKVIAVVDREKHNLPFYPYAIYKIFVLCSLLGGKFKKNIETTESGYFKLDNLPELSIEKNNFNQIKMCFDAYNSENWDTIFD
ncbi:MAG: NUDIX hydrolase [Leptotrichiaceae bacterium]|nr:NUDIX hydrolase [Leptotrichiaceae bacterium]